jgi:putative transposase
MSRRLRQVETIGRPLGADAFIARLEAESGRTLRPGKRGPRRRGETGDR